MSPDKKYQNCRHVIKDIFIGLALGDKKPGFKSLSNRECEVMFLVMKGLTNREIKKELCVEVKTVKFHLTNIYKKLKVKNRISATHSLVFEELLAMLKEGFDFHKLLNIEKVETDLNGSFEKEKEMSRPPIALPLGHMDKGI